MLGRYLKQILLSSVSRSLQLYDDTASYPAVSVRLNQSASSILALMKYLKKTSLLRFNTLVEFTAFDVPSARTRFTICIFLTSVEFNYRLSVVIPVAENLNFPTLSAIYPNSTWSEREIRDMFGIFFTGNEDLRRLLTDYGFEGYPLRKDFPLTGYVEVRYDDELQRILYEPVELSQEFRLFNLTSPWEK